jgi:hypothetical protein
MAFAKLLSAYKKSSEAPARSAAENGRKQQNPILTKLTEIWEESKTVSREEIEIPFGGLGVLIIIVDDLPHEALWRLWLEHGINDLKSSHRNSTTKSTEQIDVNEANLPVRIWIHAKFPDRIRSPWVRSKLVRTFQMKPDWGSVELTEVMVRMLEEVRVDQL